MDTNNPPFTTGTLTTLPRNTAFSFDSGVGQNSVSYRFFLSNGLTGEQLGEINPLRSGSISHDTSRTITRQMSLSLGVRDSAAVNPVTDRIRPYMVTADGTLWPLGVYMFTDQSRQKFTAGNLDNLVLNDEMFLVDQEITSGINGLNKGITNTILATLAGLPVRALIDPSDFDGTQSWTTGAGRGQILEALAVAGDLFSPWFNNNGILRFIRSFDPALVPADFDFDTGHQVLQASVVESSDILTAPNRFVVVSNSSADNNQVVVGVADIAVNAPNSFFNRGFYITKTFNLQVSSNSQAGAVAKNLAQRQTVLERVNIVTTPDPRHESHNVIRWQGSNWLELSWNLSMTAGGFMTHALRKAYT